jgi:hypothetical protein
MRKLLQRMLLLVLSGWTVAAYSANDVFDTQVSSEADDAEESVGVVDLGSSDLELTIDHGINQIVGLRFEGIAIPAGETITNAYIQFTSDRADDGATLLTVQGEAAVAAAPFTETANNLSARPRTKAAVQWLPDDWPAAGLTGLAQRTPNIATVLQEIIDQPSWQAGNAIALMITGDSPDKRAAKSFEEDPAGAPSLHIEYGGTPGNQIPLVYAGQDRHFVLMDNGEACIFPADTICLEGQVTDDEATGELQTQWQQIGGPETATTSTPDQLATSVTISEPGIYSWLLQADDSEMLGFDDVIVTVGRTINVPADAPTIQAGIDLATDGDLVLVAPGIYYETVIIDDKTITLASHYYLNQDPAMIDATVIDGGCLANCDLDAHIVRFGSGVGRDSTIMGFHVRNGNDGIMGFARINILYNHVTNTRDALEYKNGSGGLARGNLLELNVDDGIDLNRDTDLIAEHNLIRNNGGDGVEMRMYPYEGPLLTTIFRDNVIMNNEDDGIQLIDYDGNSDRVIYIERNLILNNWQSGIGVMGQGKTVENYEAYSALEPMFVTNNSIIGNDHGLTGGDNLQAYNNLFVGQTNIAIKNTDGGSATGYNLFWNNGTDIVGSNVDPDTNLYVDPQLDAEQYLMAGSPAIDAGIDQGFWFNGAAPDLGAFETPVNAAPTVDAGPDITDGGLLIALAGVVQDDGLPEFSGAVATSWQQVFGACGVEFSDASLPSTSVQFPQAGYYRLRLTADDGVETVADDISVCIEEDAGACHP